MTLNLAELTDAELAELHRKVRQESETRFLLKIPDDALVGERTGYLRRFGWQYPLGEDGDEWQQPLATTTKDPAWAQSSINQEEN